MVLTITLCIIAALIMAFTIICGRMCNRMICTPKVYDYAHELEVFSKWGFDHESFIQEMDRTPGKRDFTFRTSRGYNLRGIIIPEKEGTSFSDGRKRVVILSHGYTSNRVTMFQYARIYHDFGFNVVIPDHRWHGESDKVFCSMGYYETMDFVELAEYLRPQFPDNSVWGIHGESMGSAIAIMSAPQIPYLSFVVEDCGFTTMKDVIKSSMKFKMNLPPFPFTPIAQATIRLCRGYSVNKVRPIDSVSRIEVPMLFVHGGDDHFVPTAMVHELYAQKKDKKEIHIFEGCVHAKSCLGKPDQYRQVLSDFLRKYEMI